MGRIVFGDMGIVSPLPTAQLSQRLTLTGFVQADFFLTAQPKKQKTMEQCPASMNGDESTEQRSSLFHQNLSSLPLIPQNPGKPRGCRRQRRISSPNAALVLPTPVGPGCQRDGNPADQPHLAFHQGEQAGVVGPQIRCQSSFTSSSTRYKQGTITRMMAVAKTMPKPSEMAMGMM